MEAKANRLSRTRLFKLTTSSGGAGHHALHEKKKGKRQRNKRQPGTTKRGNGSRRVPWPKRANYGRRPASGKDRPRRGGRRDGNRDSVSARRREGRKVHRNRLTRGRKKDRKAKKGKRLFSEGERSLGPIVRPARGVVPARD